MRALLMLFLGASFVCGQGSQADSQKPDQGPPVKVNILNVCTPNAEEQKELKTALARLPKAPVFTTDYEISRGVSTVEEGKTAKYIRLRRDVKGDSPLATIQYSLSADSANTIETLVFRGSDVKELLALSIEDKLSTAVSKPSTVIESDTPASRLRVERAGKSTVGLARCQDVDQAQYEPIFAQASAVLADYRRVLKLRSMLAGDIAWLNGSEQSAARGSRK